MRESTPQKTRVLLLVGIFLLALTLRTAGLDWGIPAYDAETAKVLPQMRISYHMDEDNYLWGLTRVRPKSMDFYVPDFHWGTLQHYLIEAALLIAQGLGFVSRPWRESFVSFRPGEYARLFMVGRFVSALLGSSSIFLVYSLGNKVFNERTGIWASLMLALLPLHVVNSHYLTSDVTMVFFLLLAVAGLLSTLESPRIRNQVWAGIAFGLAVAAKYNAVFLLPVIVAVHLLQKECAWSRKAWLYLGSSFGFLLGEPYVVTHGPEFWGTLKRAYLSTVNLPEGAVPPALSLGALQLKNMTLFGLGLPLSLGLLLFGALACLNLARSRSSLFARAILARVATTRLLVLLASLVSFFVSLLCMRFPMIRYTLPIVVLSTVPIAHVMQKVSLLRWGKALVWSITLATGLYSCAQVAILMQEHTVNQAIRWVNLHVPPGASLSQGWPEIPVLNPEKYKIRIFFSGERMADFKRYFFDRDGRSFFPDYVLLDDLTLLEIPEEFVKTLKANYGLVAEFRRDPRLWRFTFPEWDAPHDWKYGHPRITIFQRKTTS